MAAPAAAQALDLVARPALIGAREPIVQAGNVPLVLAAAAVDIAAQRKKSSLFIGRVQGGLLAPIQSRRSKPVRDFSPLHDRYQGPKSDIRNLIAQAEAGGAGYDAVQHGARRKPPEQPTQMTIQEIYDWIEDTPRQQHAIGRYQFIPATLKRLVKKTGTSRSAMFSPAVQDQLADELLIEAGYHQVLVGDLSRRKFMFNLAKIWAGLPTSSGQSYYRGIAGNRATMSWSNFDTAMAQILPN